MVSDKKDVFASCKCLLDSHQVFPSVSNLFLQPSVFRHPPLSSFIDILCGALCLSHFLNSHILLPQASLNEIHKHRLEPHTVMTRWTSPGIAGKPQEGLNDLYCRRDSHLTHKLKAGGGGTLKLTEETSRKISVISHLLLSPSVSLQMNASQKTKEVVINHDPLWASNHRLSGPAVAQTTLVTHNEA